MVNFDAVQELDMHRPAHSYSNRLFNPWDYRRYLQSVGGKLWNNKLDYANEI